MRTLDDKVALARQCLAFCAGSRGAPGEATGGVMSRLRTCAVVPVKALDRAKRRLASVLPDPARQRLVLTMLEDVLAAVTSVESNRAWLSSRPTTACAALARSRGVTVVPEPGAGELDAAMTPASPMPARGAGQALILPADVPLATPEELALPHPVARRPSPV